MMDCTGEEKQWRCAKAGPVNLHMMGSIIREISDPCLLQSPLKVRRMLKPDKWQEVFDIDGKASGFHKVLKLITLGGVDPSIRPEVWEFLLGCYALGSTAEYRQQLRAARRERFKDLLMRCQKMHSSVGTGSLAYVVGCKVMDMRTSSRDDRKREDKVRSGKTSLDSTNKSKICNDYDDIYTDKSFTLQRGHSSHSGEFVSVRGSADSGACDSSCSISTPCQLTCQPGEPVRETPGSGYSNESYLDSPPLPFTNLFENSGDEKEECDVLEDKCSEQCNLRFKDNKMHSFQINNNEDLIIESNGSPGDRSLFHENSEIEIVQTNVCEKALQSDTTGHERAILSGLRISDVPQTQFLNAATSQGVASTEERVSEWLWTLHRIVVDVVRTDNHLEFYEDTRNLARMSDILAVYAWVDPATGYCQGMSDLLSPFVVLFEDDADAFWCFEMLLRRMRENFQMEGPTGVMKQLQALWHILRLTDKETFAHLSRIGAESLHFAFPMLLVLFRRELTFDEALCMWEMMWAADFNESMVYNLEDKCLEALVVQLPMDCGDEASEDRVENGNLEGSYATQKNLESCSTTNSAIKSVSSRPFCGLTRNFWARDDHMQMSTSVSLTKNGDEELAVFCVAAILIMNRQKIIRQTRSIDDLIKIFNDKLLKIHVKSCVRMAIKLRKKYFYKLVKRKESCNSEW